MVVSARQLLWLATPSHFASLTAVQARRALAILALVLLVSLTALVSPGPPPVTRDASGGMVRLR